MSLIIRVQYWSSEIEWTFLLYESGPLLKKILRDMSDKAHYNSSTNMYMYSGHDVTIAANMQTLGVYNNKEPPYASAIIYELHNDHVTNEHFVKVRYTRINY